MDLAHIKDYLLQKTTLVGNIVVTVLLGILFGYGFLLILAWFIDNITGNAWGLLHKLSFAQTSYTEVKLVYMLAVLLFGGVFLLLIKMGAIYKVVQLAGQLIMMIMSL